MTQFVRFIGKRNDYTFKVDIDYNAVGEIIGHFSIEGRKQYRVAFENGIEATIDSEDLESEIKE